MVRVVCLFCVVCLWTGFLPVHGVFASSPSSAPSPPVEEPPVEKPSLEKLWDGAQEALKKKDLEKAARLFERLEKEYPDAPQAEAALLEAGRLYEDLALGSKDPDWNRVREVYGRYVVDFRGSAFVPDAYFRVGTSYYHMRFYREAITYFDMVAKRFPESPLAPKALYWKGKTQMQIGRVEEAGKVFVSLAESPDPTIQRLATASLGGVQYITGQYKSAVATYEKVGADTPVLYIQDPEILRQFGQACLKIGDEDRGRKLLFKYINLDEEPANKIEAWFALAESYFRQKKYPIAKKFFDRVIDGGEEEGKKFYSLSRVRLAQMQDDPEVQTPETRKTKTSEGPEGDRPYEEMLRAFYSDPMAQDARYCLALRFWGRQEYDKTFEMGRAFLKRGATSAERKTKIEQIMGGVLVHWVEERLAKQDYKKVYALYMDEHQLVMGYRQGRLLYLVGKALQELFLYDEAAAVYYKALGMPLADDEVSDLQLHRVGVFLAKPDYAAAEILLKHLRKVYKDKPEFAEVCYLTGRLKEAQKVPEEALDYYGKALTTAQGPERKAAYAEAGLGVLVGLGKMEEAARHLSQYQTEDWMPPEALQKWFGWVGDAFRNRRQWAAARDAYLAALAKGMPEDGEIVQPLQLHLGEALCKEGAVQDGRLLYEKALAGPNEFWKRLARERLNQIAIEQAVVGVGAFIKARK